MKNLLQILSEKIYHKNAKEQRLIKELVRG